MNSNAMKQYGQVGRVALQEEVASATPHRLVQMLMEGALDKISISKGCMERGELQEKGRHIAWAISIIEGLKGSLNMEAGGQISQNLFGLYEYMEERLAEAHAQNSSAALDEVSKLMSEIKEGWDGVPENFRGMPAEAIQASVSGA